MTPAEFATNLRDLLRSGAGQAPKIPKNRRPFYQQIIEQFEERGEHWSPSGLTAKIITMYLRINKQPFVLSYDGRTFHVKRV